MDPYYLLEKAEFEKRLSDTMNCSVDEMFVKLGKDVVQKVSCQVLDRCERVTEYAALLAYIITHMYA